MKYLAKQWGNSEGTSKLCAEICLVCVEKQDQGNRQKGSAQHCEFIHFHINKRSTNRVSHFYPYEGHGGALFWRRNNFVARPFGNGSVCDWLLWPLGRPLATTRLREGAKPTYDSKDTNTPIRSRVDDVLLKWIRTSLGDLQGRRIT